MVVLLTLITRRRRNRMKKPPTPMKVKAEMYRLYKEEDKRAIDIAQMFRCSVQHVFRIIREIEGKPNWSKGYKSRPYGDKYNKRNNLFHFNKPMRDYEERIKVS
jgi:hypothetical protein